MFGLFIQAFAGNTRGQEETAQQKKRPVAPASGRNAYDPALPGQLIDEHRQILLSCERLEIAFSRGRQSKFREHFLHLRDLLNRHRWTEDNRVTRLIDRFALENGHCGEEIASLRRERDCLRRDVSGFIDRYDGLGFDDVLFSRFGEELSTMGEALIRLIELEEGWLFPLYCHAGEARVP